MVRTASNCFADRGARQRLEHALLAVEIKIDGALGDAGFARDVVHARAGETLLRETGQRRLQ